MKNPYKRGYRQGGLGFANLEFSGSAEREYVEGHVERIAKKFNGFAGLKTSRKKVWPNWFR